MLCQILWPTRKSGWLSTGNTASGVKRSLIVKKGGSFIHFFLFNLILKLEGMKMEKNIQLQKDFSSKVTTDMFLFWRFSKYFRGY